MRDKIEKLVKDKQKDAIKLTTLDISKLGIEIPSDIKEMINLIGNVNVEKINTIKGNYRGLKNWMVTTFLNTTYLEDDGILYPFEISKNGKSKFYIYKNGMVRYILTDTVAERRTYGKSGKLFFINNNFGITYYKNEEDKLTITKPFSEKQDIYKYKDGNTIYIEKQDKKITMKYDAIDNIIFREENGKITKNEYEYLGNIMIKKTQKFDKNGNLVSDIIQKFENDLIIEYIDTILPSSSFTQSYETGETFRIIRNGKQVFRIG
jgi:hypothetical protein